MSAALERFSLAAREAAGARDWRRVRSCARQILNRRRNSAEGHFLLGLAEKSAGKAERAAWFLSRAIDLDGKRYDAGVELADLCMRQHRFKEAAALLQRFEPLLDNSPRYLEMAGTVYANIGLGRQAWLLHRRANTLQPGVEALQANLAASSVQVGKIGDARRIYRQLLDAQPAHQRYHYELSRLGAATDAVHVDQMKAVLGTAHNEPEKNIYLCYAIAKELEDLGEWDEAFEYYKRAGDAAARVAGYDVAADVALVDTVIENCTAEWLRDGVDGDAPRRTPVFVVGLPRSGTTLTERILSSHSQVGSAGETFFLERAIRSASATNDGQRMSETIIDAAAKADSGKIARAYLESIDYRLGDEPMFVDKLPENFLYLGFIAKAFPGAGIVIVTRNAMDNCFALYKQSFFRYAYTLDDLGAYYIAYRRLLQHWRTVLYERIVEVRYEELVAEQESQTRTLLHRLGLEFEPACLHFEENRAAVNTASAVQVREKMHSRSIGRWKRFEQQLQPLHNVLQAADLL